MRSGRTAVEKNIMSIEHAGRVYLPVILYLENREERRQFMISFFEKTCAFLWRKMQKG